VSGSHDVDRLSRPPTAGQLRLYRACRVVAVGLSRLLVPGRVVGADRLPGGPFILAPVHRSYVDWLLVARVTRRRLRYMVKAEVWKSKLVGRLIEALGAFPVNRSGADREALERSRAVLAAGEPLVMFPEGTRRSGPVVEDLREGVAYLALRAGVPVVPVGIGGSERAMPRGSALPRPRRIDLVVGEPIWPPVESPPAAGGETSVDDSPARPPAAGGSARAGAATSRRTRVSRRAMKELSDELARAIQEVFDEAERQLSETTISGRPRS
jgi:1-acyl-sn-glycerol-3-phosphate acyltransferase